MSFFKYIKSKGTLSWRLIGGKSGFVLIGLVLTMIVFAILGAAILPMFSSATLNQVSANLDQKAYYMAESGFRYAASRYLHDATGEARDATLTNLSGKTFTLSGQNGGFTIDVESFFYNTSGTTSGTAYKKVPVEIVTTSSGLNGSLAVYNASNYNLTTYTGYTVAADRLGISFTGASLTPVSGRIFPAATLLSSAYTGITSMPSSLTLGGTSDLSLFPLNSGSFRIVKSDGVIKYTDLYTYKSLNRGTRTFTGVTRIQGTTASVPLASTDIVLLQRIIRLKSTGTAGDTTSNIFASRPLTYTIPVEALSGSGNSGNGTNDVQNPRNTDMADQAGRTSGASLGGWSSNTINYNIDGGGGALQPISTTGGHLVAYLPVPKTNYLSEAWYNQGNFLSYLAQVKIATGTLTPISGNNYEIRDPQPDYYGAGISFRDQGTLNPGSWRGYGLTFMRGDIGGLVTPTGQSNKSLALLSIRDENDDFKAMAYAIIPTTDRVLEQISPWVLGTSYTLGAQVSRNTVNYECTSNHVASIYDEPGVTVAASTPGWSNNTPYTANSSFVQRNGYQYKCIQTHTSQTSRDRPGTGTNWSQYWIVYNWQNVWKTPPTTPAVQHLNSWSTIVVDIQEAASITLNSDPGFVIGQSVSNGSGATGVVIDKIYNSSGNVVLLLNGSNGLGVGTFVVGNIIQGATVTAWSARDNYIRAYYGGKDSTQTGNTTSLDIINRRKYIRLSNPAAADFNWPTKNPTADGAPLTGDLFTIVQWLIPGNSVDGTIMQDRIYDGTSEVLRNTIIRSNALTTSSNYFGVAGTADDPPELGIVSFGSDDTVNKTFFDNFSYKLKGTSSSSGGSTGFLPGTVSQ